jgi:hypothetical protein
MSKAAPGHLHLFPLIRRLPAPRFCGSHILFACGLLLALCLPLRAASIALNVRPDRERIYFGEAFNLYVEVTGADAGLPTPDLSGLPAADTRLLGSNSNSRRSIQFVNGRITQDVTESRVFVFAVKPRQDGVFATGPVVLVQNGQRYIGQGASVTVTGIQAQDTVIARIQASSENVLVDEPFTITLTLAVAALPEPYASVEPLSGESPPHLQADFLNLQEIRGLKLPDLKATLEGMVVQDRRTPGFAINDYQNNQVDFFATMQPQPVKFRLAAKHLTTTGKPCWEYTLSLTYTPQQEGDFTFGPLTFKGPVIVGADRQNRALTRDIFTIGPAATVRVVPPPEQDRPDWFVGCVGRDLTVQAAFDTDVCKVGDPLTLTLDLTGAVSLANLRPPLLSLQPGVTTDFRVYDDNIESAPLPNGKRFRYRVRPLRAGTLEFPPIKAAYFDTATRAYRTVASAPIPVQARATTQIVSDTLSDAGTNRLARAQRLVALARHTPAAITVAPQGLHPDPLLPPLRRMVLPLGAGPAVYLLAIGAAWFWHRRAALVSHRRAARARRRAIGALRRREALAPADAMSIVRSFLADRLGVPAQALTPDETTRLLRDHGVPEATATAGRALLAQLDAAIYQPGAPALSATFVSQAADWIDALDAALKQTRSAGADTAKTHGLLVLALLSGTLQVRAADTQQAFLWDQTHVRMAAAKTPADYLEAARGYNRLVTEGAASGPVFFNLGTALLLAGDGPNAAAALVRAERRMGLTPAIRANLRQALALQSGQPDADLPWTRTAFFWHFDLPCRTRAHLAVAGWMVLWLALLASRLSRGAANGRWRALAGAGRVAGVTLLVVFGASVAITVALDAHDRRLWPDRVFTARDAVEEQP